MRRFLALLVFVASVGAGSVAGIAGEVCIEDECMDEICVGICQDIPLAHAHIQPGAERRVTFGLDGGQDSGLTNIFCCNAAETINGHLIVDGMDHGRAGYIFFSVTRDLKIFVPYLLTPTPGWPVWGCTFVDSGDPSVTQCSVEEDPSAGPDSPAWVRGPHHHLQS